MENKPATAAATTSPEAPPAAKPTAATETPAPARPAPLALRRGTRIQLGYRAGRVDALRFAGKKPYEVRITWDGEKYPQIALYRTLELEHEKGALKVG
jgi:hypothetical protein